MISSSPCWLLGISLAVHALHAAQLPARIVTLGPYVTENLVLLGLEQNIVGLTVHEPAERKEGKTIVGTLLEPSIERIVRLNPDIVIASREGNRPDVVARLEKLGIRVLTLGEMFSFRDICSNLRTLGRAVGREKEAERIVRDASARLSELRRKHGASRAERVFFLLGWKPLITFGNRSYLDEMVRAAGGENLFHDIARKYLPVNIEEVVRRNPDVVLILDMEDGNGGGEENRLSLLEAAARRRVHRLPAAQFGSPTPESFVLGAEMIRRLLRTGAGANP